MSETAFSRPKADLPLAARTGHPLETSGQPSGRATRKLAPRAPSFIDPHSARNLNALLIPSTPAARSQAYRSRPSRLFCQDNGMLDGLLDPLPQEKDVLYGDVPAR
jgi:hypothetical protein